MLAYNAGMPALGLPVPASLAPPAPAAIATSIPGGGANLGGVMSIQSANSVFTEAQKAQSEKNFQKQQLQPVISGIAAHIKGFFEMANTAKRQVEDDMLESLYARRGEYTAAKRQQIQAAGQPLIYMMLPSVKMRQAEALLRDVVLGAGTEKPWTLKPPNNPDLPPAQIEQIRQQVVGEVEQLIASGLQPSLADIRDRLMASKEELKNTTREAALAATDIAEGKMEDQLDTGGFGDALDQFITDLTTFKAAFIVGPIVRKKPKLTWSPQGEPVVTTALTLEWERADPFTMYPAPWARSINDRSPLARKHRLSRQDLSELRGTEGYSDDAIIKVLDQFGDSGLSNWLSIDSRVAQAEGKQTTDVMTSSGLIDALQYWGSVSGKMLLEWGMTTKQVPDSTKEYQVEAWMIGPYVIKCVLNPDSLGRRPVYSACFEQIPGSIWGHSVYDLTKDCADMCNASARSIAANMGISSGPQVGVNVSRMPAGEDVTNLYPWKVWQFEEDPMGSTVAPIQFFQPTSNVEALMKVFTHFSDLADEYTGIPKYTVGVEGTAGAGRTASGMSMMLGNASKVIKQVVGNIDVRIIEPIIERLYYYNMRYSNDPDLKIGSLTVIARGAMSLTTKDAAQVRRNEFLAATNNPVDMQIIGLAGRAEVLRSTAKTLDMNPDKIVPSPSVVKANAAIAAQQQAAQGQLGAPQGKPGQGAPAGPSGGGEQLANGAPTTDNFSPTKGA